MSPRRAGGIEETKIEQHARDIYGCHARKATEDLLLHLALKHRPAAICVTYFDEAHELGVLFWVILRLLSNQNDLTAMWFVFMTTTSSVAFFNPTIAEKSESSVFVPFNDKCLITG